MEKELHDAAVEGNVETLRKLLQQDELVLHRYISGCFKETPLHVAAMFGHLEFTKLVLTHMPEMAKELDSRKSTPLHAATANGHILVVKELLSANPEMCFAKDWKGRNPVHIGVIKGHIEILKELIRFRPQAALVLLGASTIFHICVKHYQVEALEYILEIIPHDVEFFNSKDEEGFTILHLAVAEKQTEMVKLLLQHREVEVNEMTAYGLTAMDISLAHGQKNIEDLEIVECLRQAGALGAKSTNSSRFRSMDIICSNLSENAEDLDRNETRLATVPTKDNEETKSVEAKSEQKEWLEDSRNSLMVVASLIATMAFQALISPPDGIKEAQFSPGSRSFMLFNTLGFCASIAIILLLISGLPLNLPVVIWLLMIIMWIAVLSTAITYFAVMMIVTELIPYPNNGQRVDLSTMVIWVIMLLILTLVLGHAIRLLIRMVRCVSKYVKTWRGPASSNSRRQSCV